VKTRLAQVGLVAALIVAALLLRSRDRLPGTPEEAVNALFDAASRGDDAAYLRLTTGPLLSSLESTRSQMGSRAFRETLRRSATGLKGLAVMRAAGPTGAAGNPPAGPPAQSDGEAAVIDVDLVFADRNERQRVTLLAQGEGWLVKSLDTAQMTQPSIAYGTPVFETAPSSDPQTGGRGAQRPVPKSPDGSEPPE